MKKTSVLITLLILVTIYFFIANRVIVNRNKKFYEHFNSSNIYGRLEYAKIGHYANVFKIEENDSKFVFKPITGEQNDYEIFYMIAEKGDSVKKSAYSSTLKLIKTDGKVYLYKFRNPDY